MLFFSTSLWRAENIRVMICLKTEEEQVAGRAGKKRRRGNRWRYNTVAQGGLRLCVQIRAPAERQQKRDIKQLRSDRGKSREVEGKRKWTLFYYYYFFLGAFQSSEGRPCRWERSAFLSFKSHSLSEFPFEDQPEGSADERKWWKRRERWRGKRREVHMWRTGGVRAGESRQMTEGTRVKNL